MDPAQPEKEDWELQAEHFELARRILEEDEVIVLALIWTLNIVMEK